MSDLEKLTAELEAMAQEEVRRTELARNSSNIPITRAGIKKAEAEAKKIRKRMEAKRQEIERVGKEIRAELQTQEEETRRQMQLAQQAVNKAMKPIQKIMNNLEEALTSMGLYLGRGEQIFTIRSGQPADALEPIVLRQMVLAMDEETGIFAEKDGINADNVEEFDQWLLENEAHVQQIVPETKGIVALVPRWRKRDQEERNPFDDSAKRDRLTHFLIRNGECLYRTSVQFQAGERLIPAPDEFIQFFRREKYFTDEEHPGAMKPGSKEYAEAMEKCDARSRHYLRIGLILQGLVDRTEVLHPLHPAGINFLVDPSTKPDTEKIRVILDGEGGLESGMQTFQEWREEVNTQLRVGMRIVGSFDTYDFGQINRKYDDRYDKRIFPNGASRPPTGVPLVLEKGQDGFDFKVRYKRDKVWDPYEGYRESKLKAWCSINASDKFILPYDFADAALMERFLSDRRSRRDYKELWPLMKSIWRAKRQEEEAEIPFRQMLAGVIARDNGVTVEEAEAAIPDLVRWYKLANRYHRPLVIGKGLNGEVSFLKDPGSGTYDHSKPVRLIVAEHRRRMTDAARSVDAAVVDDLIRRHPDHIAIVRPRRAGYIVLVPENNHNVYVAEHEYSAKGAPKEIRRWKLIGSRAERWKLVRGSERWEQWDRMADPQKNITGPEIEDCVARIVEHEGPSLLTITQYGDGGRFEAWTLDPIKFNPAHPLTGEYDLQRHEKVVIARNWHWSRRGAAGPIKLVRSDTNNWSETKEIPWEAKSYRKGSHVIFEDKDARQALADARALECDAKRYRSAAESVYDIVWDNLKRAWTDREMEKHQTAFLETGHLEDWPARRKQIKLEFPLDYHNPWGHHEPLEEVIQMAIEEGFGFGEPMEKVFAIAVARGLRGDTVWQDMLSGGKSGHTDPNIIPDVPECVVGLLFDVISKPAPTDEELNKNPDKSADEDEENEEPDEEENIAGKVRDVITDALTPKPEREEPIVVIDGLEILDPE